jgi:hypothetical protein
MPGVTVPPPSPLDDVLRMDAAGYSTAKPGYGFTGDPLRPIPGRYYGFLLRAAEY